MIIVRSPLRITLGGGGSDLLSYANEYGGFCVSAAINSYVYVVVNRLFHEEVLLKYSELEKVKNISDIKHSTIREALKLLNFKTPQIEITTFSDIPTVGSGCGGSGAFSVALLRALYSHRNISKTSEEIAELACDININKLGYAQGKQDEYISALGGIMGLSFEANTGKVYHHPLAISFDTLTELKENLMLFYTGITHSTNDILKSQSEKVVSNDSDIISNLHEVKAIGYRSAKALEDGDLTEFSILLNEQWENKRKRNGGEPELIEKIYYGSFRHGVLGMKLIGSGKGGFLLAYGNDKSKVRKYMSENGLQELKFNFDYTGVKQIN